MNTNRVNEHLIERIHSLLSVHDQYKLIGAYSIVKSFPRDTDWEPRETRDLDVQVCVDNEKVREKK